MAGEYQHRDIIEVSYSSLGTFGNCPRRFAYTKMLRRERSVFDDSLASACGRALHAGIQGYFTHRNADQAIVDLMMEYPFDEFEEKPEYSLEACILTLQKALDSDLFDYELVHIDMLDGEGAQPAVEVPILIELFMPVYDVTIHYRGYVDLILRDPITGRFMIWDIKTTTKRNLGGFGEKYQYDYQNLGYGLVLNTLYGDQPEFTTGIFGVVIDHKEPTILEPTHRRTGKDVEEFIRWLAHESDQICRMQELRWFPRQPRACKAFNRLCSFHEHCHLDTMDQMQSFVNPSGNDSPEPVNGGTQRGKFVPKLTIQLEG